LENGRKHKAEKQCEIKMHCFFVSKKCWEEKTGLGNAFGNTFF